MEKLRTVVFVDRNDLIYKYNYFRLILNDKILKTRIFINSIDAKIETENMIFDFYVYKGVNSIRGIRGHFVLDFSSSEKNEEYKYYIRQLTAIAQSNISSDHIWNKIMGE